MQNSIVSGTVYGFVPSAGDVVVGMYKANFRNAQLLEEFLKAQTGTQNGTRVFGAGTFHYSSGDGLRRSANLTHRTSALSALQVPLVPPPSIYGPLCLGLGSQ